ncbi:MAG: 6-bladed beta-propeller [Cytophagia bacterium]|nr:6-bladed beta-propeller [Cytophagia bacterium]
MRFSHTLLLLLISINLWSQTRHDFEHYQIDIHGERTNLFDVIEHVEIIPLEETESSLLGRVETYFPTPNGIGIIDKKNSKVQLFNNEGRYLSTINRSGDGPEEYRNLGSSVWAANDQIHLFSSQSRTILHFSLEGKYLKTTPVKYPKELSAGGLIPYENGYIVQLLDRSITSKSGHHLMFLNEQLKDIEYAKPKLDPHPFPVNLSNRFSYLNKELIWKKLISDSIFIIEDKKAKPFIKFDFGEDWIWKDPKTTVDHNTAFDAIWDNETSIWEVLSKVNEDYVILTYHYKILENDKGLIDRATGQFYRLDTRKADGENFDLYFLQWEGDRITTSLQAYDVDEFLENLKPDQYSIAGGLKYDDFKYSENPVLLRIKFR